MRSKKVAIIGAGPSGLVTAKSLLHDWPQGTYWPVIFEARPEIGGLWPNESLEVNVHQGTGSSPGLGKLDPDMRTNLSRFTVAFSDFSWESALNGDDPPLFPRARQVGQYLAAYRERYIPADVLRLAHRVVKTERLMQANETHKWKVSWIRESVDDNSQEVPHHANKVESEDFDCLVVASGYFARPHIPDLSGLRQFTGRILHSSRLEKGGASLSIRQDASTSGHTVVIGGSMSGVEAASAVALRESSWRLSVDSASDIPYSHGKVFHVHSRPFWTVPTYLPWETSGDSVSFLPLDLAMYDLSRRPPGPVQYTSGPLSEEKIAKTNAYFKSLLGTEYETYGHSQQSSPPSKSDIQPEWVAIGNEYAEFIRSGEIEAVMGRVTSIHPQSDTSIASIKIETTHGTRTLENVTTLIMATGFAPFDALSFLPESVLTSLEYDTTDPFLPLILDKGGTLRSEIPDLGFVGFYRGPYWGVMELQARLLGREWADEDITSLGATTEGQRTMLRTLRQPDAQPCRGQFPMGDYVGLMESLARDLGIERTALSSSDGEGQTGPVIPARYAQKKDDVDVRRTLNSLHAVSRHNHAAAQAAASLAIFRALHGRWKMVIIPTKGKPAESGTTTFIPRFPSSPKYDREYVVKICQDVEDSVKSQAPSLETMIFRLSEAGGADEEKSQIHVYHVTADTGKEIHNRFAYRVRLSPFYRAGELGTYVVRARGLDLDPSNGAGLSSSATRFEYTFRFQGVSITEWECTEVMQDDAHDVCFDTAGRGRARRVVYRR